MIGSGGAVARLAVMLVLAGLVACGGKQTGESTEKALVSPAGETVSLLPSSDLPTETVVSGEAQLYTGRELFDYIDGGADLYLEFGFVDAAVREYKSPAGEDITASIYRMEDPEAAFGIFSVNRRGASEPAKMGAIGARSEYEFLFCHGVYYVQVQSTATDSVTGKTIDQIAARIDSSLAGQPSDWPEALKLLPRTGFVPHSEVYVEGPLGLGSRWHMSDENLLALSDTVPGVMASFMVRQGGHPALYLVVEYPDSAFAQNVFAGLEQHFAETAEQERAQDPGLQFKSEDGRLVYSSARTMDAIVLKGVNLTALFENITAGHGSNPHGGSGIANPHGGGMGGMMSPHGAMPGGMANPHGGDSSGSAAPNPHGSN
jgi:hypothetical protein